MAAYGFCWMDLKTHDLPGTAAFFSAVMGWDFAVDEDDWRKATKIAVGGRWIGGVSDLANPVHPPGTPAHIAYYLAVDDADRRVAAATERGAQLVVPPFDAGDQGRIAALIDPVGAAFALWQRTEDAGWDVPPGTPGAPYRMTLSCEQPDMARQFYTEVAGAPLAHADFLPADAADGAPQWELTVGVEDLAGVVTRAREHGGGTTELVGPGARLSSAEGLTVVVRPLEP
ncbi:VOC family protein [Streptomyces sp. NPDC041068]|uniref:VOC family protein n=1 Tax=Streptomyces sp. NPDC041068 TaxID=3155130 RepID=UPI0033E18F70